ncbi:MAG: RcnB family protein [Proteobacteria bacterium]|nr:RcnB family protein [Pseudomonadota bacterium]
MSPRLSLFTGRALAIAIAGMVAFSSALAEKPAWAGEGKGRGSDQERDGQRGQDSGRGEGRSQRQEHRNNRVEHFGDPHRSAVREYYGSQFQSGRCPPGLANKHNGCLPPGQARKWTMGRPLPREVIYYEVPRPLVLQLGQPPAGYRYVRVAGDILLIAVGTALVVDAIQDLGR